MSILLSIEEVLSMLSSLVKAIKELGGDESVLEGLMNHAVAKEVAQVLMRGKTLSDLAYRTPVDCRQTLAEMIAACNFDWVDSDIKEEAIPIIGAGMQIKNLVLMEIDENSITPQVLERMALNEFEPSGIVDLLAFIRAYPAMRRFSIIAIGDEIRTGIGRNLIVALDHCAHGTGLSLYADFESGEKECWHAGTKFLASRKSKK